MTELPFGIDLSAYQYSQDGTRKPDFDVINSTCAFVAVRAGISWGYVDKWFSYSWQRIARPRLAYHVVYPGESAGRQMDHFLDIVKPGEHDRLVLDMELDHGYSKARITDTLLGCLERILANTGRYPVIYSRASWVNQFLDVSRLPELDWWLAGYRKRLPSPLYTAEATPPPALPKGVSNWLIHQTAEHGNGSKYGVASHYVDIDRWNTDNQGIATFFGLTEDAPPEPTPPEVPEVKLFDAKVYDWATPYINIRKEPDIHSQDLGDLYPGTVVPVYEIVNDWYKTTNGFVMSKYLQRLDYQPPVSWLVIEPVSQRDPRWANHKLGNSNYTIGGYGCLITAISMVLNWYGKDTDPAELNDALVRVGGFADANLYWQAITNVQPDVHLIKAIDCYSVPAPLHEIDALLADSVPVLVHVDFIPGGAIDQHWVLITGKSGDDYIINDPWDGLRGGFRAKYGDPARWIFRIRAYRRLS